MLWGAVLWNLSEGPWICQYQPTGRAGRGPGSTWWGPNHVYSPLTSGGDVSGLEVYGDGEGMYQDPCPARGPGGERAPQAGEPSVWSWWPPRQVGLLCPTPELRAGSHWSKPFHCAVNELAVLQLVSAQRNKLKAVTLPGPRCLCCLQIYVLWSLITSADGLLTPVSIYHTKQCICQQEYPVGQSII